MKKSVFLPIIISLLIFVSCSTDTNVVPLPQEVAIDVLGVDLQEGQLTLRGSQVLTGQTGIWEVLSTNNPQGSFSSTTSFNTVFTGNIYEEYRISWTISNGVDETRFSNIYRISAMGFSLVELIQADRDIARLLEWYTFDDLWDIQPFAPIGIQEFIDAGVSIEEIATRASVTTLIAYGLTIQQLIDIGFTLDEILSQVSISNLYFQAGFSVEDLINTGFTYQQIYDGLKSNGNYYTDPIIEDSFLQEFLALNITVQELIDDGIDLLGLYFHGITIDQFADENVPFRDIILSVIRVTPLDFIQAGYDAPRLLAEDIITETSNPGFYVMKYLHNNTGWTGETELNLINNSYHHEQLAFTHGF